MTVIVVVVAVVEEEDIGLVKADADLVTVSDSSQPAPLIA